MHRTIFIILSILLVACSESSYDQYLGYWSKPGRSNNKVIEIKKVNGNYILDENAFEEPTKGNGDLVLIKKDGILAIEYGYSLALSEDKNELIVSGVGTGKRISNEQFNELNKLEQKKIANAKKCEELIAQAEKENPEAFNQSFYYKPSAKSQKIKNEYQAKDKKLGLTSCRI